MSQKRKLDGDEDINLSLDEIARKNRISSNNASGSSENYHQRNKSSSHHKRKKSKWDRLKDDDDDDDSEDDDLDSSSKKYSSSDEDEPIDIKRNSHELEEAILETPQSQAIHGINSHNSYFQDNNVIDTRSTPTSDFNECSNEGSVSEYEDHQQQQQQQNHYPFSHRNHNNNNDDEEKLIKIPRNTYFTQQKNLHNNFPNKYQKFNNHNLNRKRIYRQPRQQSFFSGQRSFNNNSRMNNNNNNNRNRNNNDDCSSDDEPVDITKGTGGDFAVEETMLNFNYNTAQQPFSMIPIQTFPSSASSSSPSSSTSSLSYNFNLEQSQLANSNGSSSVSSLDGIGPMNKKVRFQNENIFFSPNVPLPNDEINSISQNSMVGNQTRTPFFLNVAPPKTNNIMPIPLKKRKIPTDTNDGVPEILTRNPFLASSQKSEKQTVDQNPFFPKSQKTEINNPFFAVRKIVSQVQQQPKLDQNPFLMTPKKSILSSSKTTDKKENQQVVVEKKENPFLIKKLTKPNLSNSNNNNNTIHNQKPFIGVATPKMGCSTEKKLITFESDADTEKEIKMAVIDSDSDDLDERSVSKKNTDSRNSTLDSSLDLSGILSPQVSCNFSLDEIIAKKTGKSSSRRDSFNNSKSIDTRPPPELCGDSKMMKYWHQRYKLFSKYDEGIKLDYESWYSVTPEEIASCIAERCKNPDGVIIDAFCGCGGNTIQFASRVKKVIAIDIDPIKIEYAKHNARIYGVYDKIEFAVGNFMELAPFFKADMVFLSPPWGGVDYLKSRVFDLRTMIPLNGFKVFELARTITPNIAYFVPRTTDREQLLVLAGTGIVDIEQNKLGSRVTTITAYYGQLAKLADEVKATT